MQLSIIIPTLNESDMIRQAITRAQDLCPSEIIVVDGGSDDGTVKIAESSGARVKLSPEGRGRQLNIGAKSASGDVLLFLHADTWLAREGSEQIADALTDSDVIAGAFYQRIEAEGPLYRWLERGNALRAHRWGLPYGDQGIFMRRVAFDEVGGYPDISIMEDLLMMRKLRKLTKPVLLPGPLHISARRWQRNGVVRQTLRNWSLLVAERMGIAPERLRQWYEPHKSSIPKPTRPSSSSVAVASGRRD